jgi:hypothetical protein
MPRNLWPTVLAVAAFTVFAPLTAAQAHTGPPATGKMARAAAPGTLTTRCWPAR